jgi:hypothetical protein
MAKGLCDHYSAMRPYLREQTRQVWGLGGLWVPETVLPWGHAEDIVLKDEGRGVPSHYLRWDPTTAPYGRFQWYNPYVGFLYTAGPELCHHYLTYYQYSGDEEFLRRQAYPMVRDVVEFLGHLLRIGDDGQYHLDPANALETWWMVRDPSDALDGVRAVFPEFVQLSRKMNADQDLRERCDAILAALPDPPRGLWSADGTVDPDADVYAPAAGFGLIPGRHNAENPALYRVYPFGLSGIGTQDCELARRTFEHRICPLGNGWSLDAVWAARLGLADEACRLTGEHARRFNRFRYGGWTSNDNRAFPGGLSVVPFTDAGGLSAFALQEILLQSHGGRIRVAPATTTVWSGIFQLLAEGGMLVAADVCEGRVRLIEVRSLRGNPCTIENPWPTACVVREGETVVLNCKGPTLQFDTRPGGVYLLEPAEQWRVGSRPEAICDRPNRSPGLPGRDEER